MVQVKLHFPDTKSYHPDKPRCVLGLQKVGEQTQTRTCDEPWMGDPVCGVLSVMAQVSDLHVAIIDAENKGQSKGDEWCRFTTSD